MSLLRRVERAQQELEQRRAAEQGLTLDGTLTASAPQADAATASASTAVAPPPAARPATGAPDPRPLVPVMAPARSPLVRNPTRDALLLEIRQRLVTEVITAFDTLLEEGATDVRAKIEGIVDRTISANGYAVTRDERTRLVDEMADDVTGFGPLEPLLHDDTITEVMVNGPTHVYIERAGKIERVESAFLNNEHVLRIIDRIITPMGRRIDEMSPRVDARLPDGSRVNAIVEPLSLVGPVITVRKFSQTPYTVADLVRFGTATPEMFEFLRVCIEARLNLFVSGGTGSGKTTTLNVLSSFIPNDERIVTIEDAAELQLRQDHVITLESRPPNLEGEGEITIRHLLKNAMHMRPDRIIVGECRSGEALDMLQAMTTGHDGSLSTGHANTPKDMLRRLETMVLMTGYELPLRAIREQIASAVDLIVHTSRLKDGTRKIVNITEVYGIEDDEILTQDIFAFDQTDFRDGKIQGSLAPTGIRPTFMDQFRKSGITLPEGEYGIPSEDKAKPRRISSTKGRWGAGDSSEGPIAPTLPLGYGKAVKAGGMVYVSAIGPIDPDNGQVVGSTISAQAKQTLANLKAKLQASGTSLDKVVWANWSLRDPTEFDLFNEEWVRWFPGDGPIGQSTIMTPLQRRAGFRLSIGVIAEA